MNQGKDTRLGTEKVSRLLFRLAIPAVLAQIVNMLYNVVDRIDIGHMPLTGADALSGLGVCTPLIFIIAAFAALLYFGSAAKASMSMGRGEPETAQRIMGGACTLLIAVSLVLTVLSELLAEKLLFLFGASEVTIRYALPYFRIYACGSVFVSLTLGMNAFITAQGFAKTGMITVVIGAVCNIVLDGVFIYGFNMGVQGAALATVISQAVSAVWALRFLRGSKTVLRLRRDCMRPDWKLMLPCIALGASPFIMQATESVLNICFNSSLLKYGGDLAVGAMTILMTVVQCALMVVMGFSQGATPIISYNFGAKNAERVRAAFRLLLLVNTVFTVLVWLVCQLFPTTVTGIMAGNAELRTFSAWALRIYTATLFMFGIQCTCQQSFIAIGNAPVSMFLAILRKIILLIPLIYILPHFFEDKTFAVYLAEPIADAVAAVTTGILFAYHFKKALAGLKAERAQ